MKFKKIIFLEFLIPYMRKKIHNPNNYIKTIKTHRHNDYILLHFRSAFLILFL